MAYLRYPLSLLLVILLVACNSKRTDPEPILRRVKIETLQMADTLTVRSYPGILKEAGEIKLAFRVGGPIAEIAVREGDYVRAGQLIARIDPRDYEVQLEVAQAQYDQVVAEAGRVKELHSRQSIAGNDYDKAVSGERMVAARLKNARDQLQDTRLLAPVSGYIQEVNFTTTELIDAGMPVASLLDVSRYLVEVEVPVSLFIQRQDIQKVTGRQTSVSKDSFPLILLEFSKKASFNQLYKLHLALDPAIRPGLSPGMDMQVYISLRSQEKKEVCVPLSALFNKEGKYMVWVYNHDDQVVREREVETGDLTGEGRIGISKGLQAGEAVVVAGVNMLSDGQKVQVLEPATFTNVGGML